MKRVDAILAMPAPDMLPAPALIPPCALSKAGARSVTHVTQPFLPPLSEYMPYLEAIWANKWLTNCGPFHEELEARLATYLDVPQVSLMSNGTIALWIALQALKIDGGEVITTPFTFVATAHALRLVNATPVFVDIDPDTCNLDAAQVEAAITPRTTAIMPVHCFGQPCDVEGIDRVADFHELKVIYDAAHAFGVRKNGRSILTSGDLSTLSFHATKVFNTFEGGAIISPDAKTKARIDRLRNFGFAGETVVARPSLNGKMNELQAAFGLLQLRYVDAAIARRGEIAARYRTGLAGIEGITPLPVSPDWTMNHSYFPVRIEPDYPMTRDALWTRLQAAGILARRYFHPLICDMPGYRKLPSAQAALPVARRIAAEILCLPLHTEVSDASQMQTIGILADV